MKTPFLHVTQGVLKDVQGPILEGLDFIIPNSKITSILGPSGTGKTLLLCAITQRLPMAIQRAGEWVFGNADSADFQEQQFIKPQSHRNSPMTSNEPITPSQDAFAFIDDPHFQAVFLDEPVSGFCQEEIQAFIKTLRERHANQTIVIITHNLKLAREVSDHIVMICAGKQEVSCPAETFFSEPPTELAKQFVRAGNCWPKPEPLPLPNHFRWIIPEKMAGVGKPGLLRSEDLDLESMAMAGITHLVSLTHDPFPPKKLHSFGLQARHLRITDMRVPSLNSAASLISAMDRNIKDGNCVAYHCRAGLGRTGTILACHLVWRGYSAQEAIDFIRKAQPGYIQTKAQEDFVFQFETTYSKTP